MTAGGPPDDGDGLDKLDKDDLVQLEREMTPLLDALRGFAREEEAEIGTYAANTSHALSQQAKETAVRRILALQARERVESGASGSEVQAFAATDPAGDRPAAASAPDGPRRPRLRFSWFAAGGLVVAAAIALGLYPPARDSSLPAYSVAARGGIRDTRALAAEGAGEGPAVAPEQRLAADSELVVVARPETAVTGVVAARAFVVQGSDAAETPARAQVAPTGAIELRFRGSDLIGSRRGAAILRVIVGRPDALEAITAESAPPASQEADARWRVLTVPLQLGQP
jgi:hypothetical protein